METVADITKNIHAGRYVRYNSKDPFELMLSTDKQTEMMSELIKPGECPDL